mgnify:CR=1 FL=1
MKEKIWRELLINNPNEANILVLGLPYDGAVSCGKGASLAPQVLRELSSYLPPVSYNGSILKSKIYDFGDVDFIEAEEKINQVMNNDKFKLFIGGDHSISIKTQKAFIDYYKGKKVGIIHCDAHADLSSSFIPLSHACVNKRAVDSGINDEDIVYIGLRSWEIQELEYFSNHPEILSYPMESIRSMGINNIFELVNNKFKDYEAIYLSVDIDCLDPAYAPGTGTPEAGGLTSFELMGFVKAIVNNLPVFAMDVVEVSPPLDVNNITSWAALKLIYEVFFCLDNKH